MSAGPDLLRGLTSARVSRRGLLAGGGAAALAALLTGCSIKGSAGSQGDPVDWTAFWRDAKETKDLNFANWPLYIDSDHGKSESLRLFEQETGIAVDYQAVIQDNATFYATVSPILRAKGSTGYDLVVMTNGYELTEMIKNGFVCQLDRSRMPNFAKYASDSVQDPNYDPGNKHSVVWQTGFTGLAYNPKYTGRKITSFQDLLDPAFRGRIGLMSDNTELGSLALLALGIAPETSTPSDWRKAQDWLRKLRPSVAGFYDQSYVNRLENGDTWITQAWSGDVFQAQQSGFPDLEFVTPDEGQMMWHDNMLIPKQAANPLSALTWMDYYYTPRIAGIVEDYVNYVCPVPGAEDYVRDELKDPTVADSPLVFPDASVLEKSHEFRVFANYDEYSEWNGIFNAVVQS
ncbi:spermidine/putrescine ABC transporter substrate-binding protein [Curtobacterium sp. MCLR17_007]|uniref:polyamine ABC transporter substrate-binding protein n=1 Tax=unclassified Curtobacterium TaxID=257496 RepID=UPI000700180F|nr:MULTISPECIES: spermidine/putrescine ABC transporter substrate-binding protein [unclassified Curtobacterium]KQS09856.1 ABC transporter substrate-binding protein [Curtobacterium sp. Leaf183]WIB60287.1 spermidine/putrescine ABC transporter substrate-binding protein [Curtobacterium sp. MCLR17_007]